MAICAHKFSKTIFSWFHPPKRRGSVIGSGIEQDCLGQLWNFKIDERTFFSKNHANHNECPLTTKIKKLRFCWTCIFFLVGHAPTKKKESSLAHPSPTNPPPVFLSNQPPPELDPLQWSKPPKPPRALRLQCSLSTSQEIGASPKRNSEELRQTRRKLVFQRFSGWVGFLLLWWLPVTVPRPKRNVSGVNFHTLGGFTQNHRQFLKWLISQKERNIISPPRAIHFAVATFQG